MPELSDKPHYLNWVVDQGFIKKSRAWAKKHFGTIPKDIINEILTIEGSKGIKEEKYERAIHTHFAVFGEFPESFDQRKQRKLEEQDIYRRSA